MKQYKMLLRTIVLSMLLMGMSSLALAQTVIKGVVVDGVDSHPLPEKKVELRRSADPGKPGELVSTTTTNSEGRFQFQVPASEKDSMLVVVTEYQGFPYEVPAYDGGKRLTKFDVQIDPSKVRLPVFETTTSLVPLSIMVQHLRVEPRAGGIKCQEWIVVNNPTNKTFLGLGKNRATVLLSLPKGAKKIHLNSQIMGAKLVENPGGYSISKPIPPTLGGKGTAFIVDYEMDWPSSLPWGRSLDLSREIQYPTPFFFVQRATTDKSLQVTGTGLTPDQSIQMNIDGQPQSSLINSIGNPKAEEPVLVPGDQLKIQVASPINPTFWVFVAFLVLLIILIPFSLWRRSSAPSPTDPKADKMGEPVQETSVYGRTLQSTDSSKDDWLQTPAAQHLVQRIAELDEAHAAGNVTDDEYKVERDACKTALLKLTP